MEPHSHPPHPPYTITSPQSPTSAHDFILDSYLMHIRTQHCRSCNNQTQWSELQEVRVHRSNGARRLTPNTAINPSGLRPDLSIGITRLPTRLIPICHYCVDNRAAPIKDISSAEAQAEWSRTLARKYAAPPSAERTATVKPSPSPKVAVAAARPEDL